MSTIRVVKNSNYSVINNTVINDSTLSWEAKGLAVYLLSKPDDWRINTNQLWNASANGHGTVKRILRELEEAGFLRRMRMRAPDGTFVWDHAVYETPQDAAAATDEDAIDTTDADAIGQTPLDGIRPMESVEWFPSDILSTENQVLNKEQGQPRAAALPPAPPSVPPSPVVLAEPLTATAPEPPAPSPTVAAALDGDPLPVAPVPATTKNLAQQPVVLAYRDVFLAYPSKAQMVQLLGHGVTDMQRWSDVLAAWCKAGYSPRNLAGMLDWYDDPQRMAASRPQPRASTAATGGKVAPRTKVEASMQAVDNVMAMIERGEL